MSGLLVAGTSEEAVWNNAAVVVAEDMRAAFVPADVFDRAKTVRDGYRERAREEG